MIRRERIVATIVAVVAMAGPFPVSGEMGTGDYDPGARRLSPSERVIEEGRLREQRERSEAIEREREAQAEKARREEEARLAARPPGVRLVESRCGTCHGADSLREARYGRLGWWAVLARMEVVNGARFGPGERRIIVAHLAETQAAGLAQEALEWLLVGAVLSMVSGIGWRLWRGAR